MILNQLYTEEIYIDIIEYQVKISSYLCLLDFVGAGFPSSSRVENVSLLFSRDTRFLAKLTRDKNSSLDIS